MKKSLNSFLKNFEKYEKLELDGRKQKGSY